MSPALAGRFTTTGPPGKSPFSFLKHSPLWASWTWHYLPITVVNLSKLVQDFPTSGTESPASQEALSSRKTRIMLQTNLSPFPWCLSLGSPKRKFWDKDLSASSLFWGEVLHSSTLAWKIPWMEEPGRLQSMRSLEVGHDWATSISLFTFTHWRTKWQPTPVFLPGESQGRGSLVGCRLRGRTELDTTEVT